MGFPGDGDTGSHDDGKRTIRNWQREGCGGGITGIVGYIASDILGQRSKEIGGVGDEVVKVVAGAGNKVTGRINN